MSPYKIMIVDNPKNIENIETCLSNACCSIISANSGLAALKVLRESPIDILVTRQELLDINGIGLFDAIKNQRPDMHCIIMSDRCCRIEPQDASRLDLLMRPFEYQDLASRVTDKVQFIQRCRLLKQWVMIVEDTRALMLTQMKMLKNIGFSNILSAQNGHQAIETLESSENKPALIISDWYMPEMNGLEFLQWLRKSDIYKDIRFIMATSQAETKKAMDAGADAFLIKPFDMETFQKVIWDLV